jgi:hypothetical protein
MATAALIQTFIRRDLISRTGIPELFSTTLGGNA